MRGLKVCGVSFAHHPGEDIFTDLSFALEPGSLMLVTGGNGRGKTTLLKCLVGLLPLRGGEVRLSACRNLDDIRSQCSYLAAEQHGVLGYLSADENLRYFSCGDGGSGWGKGLLQRRQREATLQHWGFRTPYVRHHLAVEFFSTGMKRRLALAKVQLQDRILWLLDEPTYGLDRRGIELLVQCLSDHLEGEGMALIATHHPDVFRHLNFTQWVLGDGHD